MDEEKNIGYRTSMPLFPIVEQVRFIKFFSFFSLEGV